MTRKILGPVLAAIATAALMAGCTTTGTTGSTGGSRGGGWENFRAEVAALSKNA